MEKYNPPPDKAPNCRTCLHRWGKPLSRNKSVRKNILSIGNFLIQRFRVFPYLWSRDKSVGGVGLLWIGGMCLRGVGGGAVVWSLFVFQSPETEDGKWLLVERESWLLKSCQEGGTTKSTSTYWQGKSAATREDICLHLAELSNHAKRRLTCYGFVTQCFSRQVTISDGSSLLMSVQGWSVIGKTKV